MGIKPYVNDNSDFNYLKLWKSLAHQNRHFLLLVFCKILHY